MRFKNPSYPKQLNIGHGHLKNSTKIRISQGWPNSWQSTPLAIWVYAQFLHLQAFSGFKEHSYSEELYLLINKCQKWRIFNLAFKTKGCRVAWRWVWEWEWVSFGKLKGRRKNQKMETWWDGCCFNLQSTCKSVDWAFWLNVWLLGLNLIT